VIHALCLCRALKIKIILIDATRKHGIISPASRPVRRAAASVGTADGSPKHPNLLAGSNA
jgi:hypothetical protein